MVTHAGGKPFSCEICNKAYQVSWYSKGLVSRAGNCCCLLWCQDISPGHMHRAQQGSSLWSIEG